MPAFEALYAVKSAPSPLMPVGLPVRMIDPPPEASIARTECFTVRNVPVRLTSIVRRQFSRSRSPAFASLPNSCTPALATTTSGDQPPAASSANAASTDGSSEMSIVTARPRPPSACPAAATAASPLRSAYTTRAPSRAKRSATDWPIPVAAPVTRAVLPLNRSVTSAPPRVVPAILQAVNRFSRPRPSGEVARLAPDREQRHVVGRDGADEGGDRRHGGLGARRPADRVRHPVEGVEGAAESVEDPVAHRDEQIAVPHLDLGLVP